MEERNLDNAVRLAQKEIEDSRWEAFKNEVRLRLVEIDDISSKLRYAKENLAKMKFDENFVRHNQLKPNCR